MEPPTPDLEPVSRYAVALKIEIFPERAWPREWVKRLCMQAHVPIACAHSMRRLHATRAIAAGASPDLVARTLGH